MSDYVPDPWAFILLALAAFRAWKLAADDEILDRPRALVLRWLRKRGEKFELFLLCPWCLGFHLSLGVYLLWLWLPTATLIVSTALALSAAVGLIAEKGLPTE